MSTIDNTVKEGRVMRPFFSRSQNKKFSPGDTYKGINTDYLVSHGFIDDVKEVKRTRTRTPKTTTE